MKPYYDYNEQALFQLCKQPLKQHEKSLFESLHRAN